MSPLIGSTWSPPTLDIIEETGVELEGEGV